MNIKNLEHKICYDDIKSALDNSIQLCSCTVAGKGSKRIVFTPSTGKYSVRHKVDGIEVQSPFSECSDAINKYNEII